MSAPRPNLLPGARRPRHSSGFTLLELVLVMLVLCIIVGMAAPVFYGFAEGRKAEDAAQHFAAIARYARGEAVARGRVVRLNIDAANHSYFVTVQRGAVFERLGEEMGRDFSFPEDVNVECDAPTQPDGQYIEFQPTGRCDPANLHFIGPNNRTVLVACLSATELFQVQPPDTQVAWGAWAAQKAQTQAQMGGGR